MSLALECSASLFQEKRGSAKESSTNARKPALSTDSFWQWWALSVTSFWLLSRSRWCGSFSFRRRKRPESAPYLWQGCCKSPLPVRVLELSAYRKQCLCSQHFSSRVSDSVVQRHRFSLESSLGMFAWVRLPYPSVSERSLGLTNKTIMDLPEPSKSTSASCAAACPTIPPTSAVTANQYRPSNPASTPNTGPRNPVPAGKADSSTWTGSMITWMWTVFPTTGFTWPWDRQSGTASFCNNREVSTHRTGHLRRWFRMKNLLGRVESSVYGFELRGVSWP